MFCEKCGEQLLENAKFCVNCGIRIERDCEKAMQTEQESVKQAYALSVDRKHEETSIGYPLSLKTKLMPRSDSLEDMLEFADRVCKEGYAYYDRATLINNNRVMYHKRMEASQKNRKIVGIIALICAAWSGFLPMLCFIGGYEATNSDDILGIMFINVVFGIPALICLFVAIYQFVKYKKEKEITLKTENDYMKQANDAMCMGNEYFSQNAFALLQVIPTDYWYPLATEYLYKAVQQKRAFTLGEAIDKFLEQLHRWKVEEANMQIVALQQKQAVHLRNIQSSAAVTAASSAVSAAANVATAASLLFR